MVTPIKRTHENGDLDTNNLMKNSVIEYDSEKLVIHSVGHISCICSLAVLNCFSVSINEHVHLLSHSSES